MLKKDYALEEMRRSLERTESAVAALRAGNTAAEKRDAWEDFLYRYTKTLGQTISASNKFPESRAFGHTLRNASQKDNPLLVYIREARNIESHGLEPSAAFRQKRVSVGAGAVKIGGDSHVVFKGNYVNGVPMGDFTIETQGGQTSWVWGAPNPDVPIVDEAEIALKPVVNLEKGITVPVPKEIDGKPLDPNRPLELAERSIEVLTSAISKFDRIVPAQT